MKPTYAFIVLACFLFSCNTIKSIAVKEGNFPLIGTIGKEKSTVLKTHFIQIGHPVLENHIALSMQVTPFTSKSFGAYTSMKEQQGLKSVLGFADSLELKPTYTTFEINDRIGLKEALNSEVNKHTKSYLEKDAANRLVSSISIVLNPRINTMLSNADGVFLVTDTEGLLWIEMVHNNQKQKVSIPKNEIFDYELMGVCWGENNYGKTRVETFNDRGRCPEGTARNVRKLEELPSFLKL